MKRYWRAVYSVLLVSMCTVQAESLPQAYRIIAAEYQIPAPVLYQLAQSITANQLSTGNIQPWPWIITIDGRTESFPNQSTAQQALQRYLKHGQQRLSIGLLQLNSAQFSDPAAALDPWRNLRTGAAILKRHYGIHGDWAAAASQFSQNNAVKAHSLPPINWRNKQRFAADVARIAKRYQLEPALIHAVISAESAYKVKATSSAGAQGLMQLMPATAQRFGVRDAYQPLANIDAGSRYLRWLLDTFQALPLALAGYNAGENAVRKYGYRIPPYRETQAYVPRVLAYYRYFRLRELQG